VSNLALILSLTLTIALISKPDPGPNPEPTNPIRNREAEPNPNIEAKERILHAQGLTAQGLEVKDRKINTNTCSTINVSNEINKTGVGKASSAVPHLNTHLETEEAPAERGEAWAGWAARSVGMTYGSKDSIAHGRYVCRNWLNDNCEAGERCSFVHGYGFTKAER